MSKITHKFRKFGDMNFPGHHLAGFVWNVQGSEPEPYAIELTEKGFTCSCWGHFRHGKCKHTQQVHDRLVEE